jgi:hypothetical protein
MKIRATIAAIGTAAALGLTGTILLPAAAGAGTATHTLTFTAVQKSQAKFSAASSGSAGLDIGKTGKTTGFNMLNFTVNPATGKLTAGVTIDTAGGFLYGTLHVSSGPVTHGTVTGGTGTFAGVTGTITATNKTATRTAVTITYHT